MDDFLSSEIEGKKADVKRRPYVIWEVGENEYKLKLTAANIAKLEDKFRKNLLIMVSDEGLPALSTMLMIIQAAMLPFNHNIKQNEVFDIFDRYVDEGGDQQKLLADVIFPVLSVSGFFTESQSEEVKEKVKELDSPL